MRTCGHFELDRSDVRRCMIPIAPVWMKLASVQTLLQICRRSEFKSAGPSSNPTRSNENFKLFFHNLHINTLHIMHTGCPIRNCGLVFINCIFRQLCTIAFFIWSKIWEMPNFYIGEKFIYTIFTHFVQKILHNFCTPFCPKFAPFLQMHILQFFCTSDHVKSL